MKAPRFSRAHSRTLSSRAVLAALLASIGLIGVATARTSVADVLPANCSGTTTITCTFNYNGTDGVDGSAQTWVVPAGVTSAYFDIFGAQGGHSVIAYGGLGGETSGIVALTPGSSVSILVGGSPQGDHGGFNGGGEGGNLGHGG